MLRQLRFSVKRGSLVRIPVENQALRSYLNVNGAENAVEFINSLNGFYRELIMVYIELGGDDTGDEI